MVRVRGRRSGSNGQTAKALNHGADNDKSTMKGKGKGKPTADPSPGLVVPVAGVPLEAGPKRPPQPPLKRALTQRPPPPPPRRRRAVQSPAVPPVPPPVPLPKTPPEIPAPRTPPEQAAGFQVVHKAVGFLQGHYAKTVHMAHGFGIPAPPPPILPTSADRSLMRAWWGRPTWAAAASVEE